MSKIILADSDALFALSSRSDAVHQEAKQIAENLTQKGFEFTISNFVLAEITTLLNYRISHQKAVSFVDQLAKDQFPVIKVDQETENLAYRFFRKQTTKNVSMVDCTNMAVMKKFGWDTIFSFDKIYPKNGFKLAKV